MGAEFENDHLPMTIYGKDDLKGITYESPIASAQVKSATLLAGLKAAGKTTVIEPFLSRDHTERMLRSLGVTVESGFNEDGRAFATVYPHAELDGFDFSPPADISSAAFWIVAAMITPGSHIQLVDVGLNPARTGILDVLDQCGADYDISNESISLGEPFGTISVRFKTGLRPFVIKGALVSRLIDEIPILCVLATQIEGESIVQDASELRVKESDRIDEMAIGLRSMGGKVETFADGLAVNGVTKLKSARIDAKGDHRIAMSFAIASSNAEGQCKIDGSETISTSYPEFWEDFKKLTHG